MIASSWGRYYNVHDACLCETLTCIHFLSFPVFVTHTYNTLTQTSNSLQSAALPCWEGRTTPRSENNWNQFKDTYFLVYLPLPHTLSSSLSLSASVPLSLPLTAVFCFSSCTTWALQGCSHNLGHSARPHFSHTHTHMYTHTHSPLCVLPDTARWERLHYQVELWPCFGCLAREPRCMVCVCVCVCGSRGGVGGLCVSPQMTPLAIIKSTLFSGLWHIFFSPYVHIFLQNPLPKQWSLSSHTHTHTPY